MINDRRILSYMRSYNIQQHVAKDDNYLSTYYSDIINIINEKKF